MTLFTQVVIREDGAITELRAMTLFWLKTCVEPVDLHHSAYLKTCLQPEILQVLRVLLLRVVCAYPR